MLKYSTYENFWAQDIFKKILFWFIKLRRIRIVKEIEKKYYKKIDQIFLQNIKDKIIPIFFPQPERKLSMQSNSIMFYLDMWI